MAGRPKLNADQVAERREEIVRAAAGVFAERGYSAAQIADVAAVLGIGHGTIYRYFEDKQALLDAVIAYALQRVAEALAPEAPSADDLDGYRAQVRGIGERLYALASEEQDVLRVILREGIGAGNERVEAALEAFAELSAAYMNHGKKRGFFRKDFDTALVARAINALIFEGARHVMRADDPDKAMKKWSREIPELFIRGIEAR